MPFTTKEIVKKHILDHHIGSSIIANEFAQLTGSDSCQLSRQMILASSETVKAKGQNNPSWEAINFAYGDNINLASAKIISDSVVVASDSSLGRIYVENVDYHIDYDLGVCRRIQSGGITAGGNVVIWYLQYRIYLRGVDYDIDYQAGSLRRRSSGALESGQTVLVDYTAEYGNLDDDAIDNAISEANELVISFIDEAYREASEKGLVIAETYLAVSIICRIKSIESMSLSNIKVGNNAGSWAAISDMYRKEAFSVMSRYAAPVGNLKPPSKA
jgi:hypothetical protein